MYWHIVQSPEWAEVKNEYGSKSIRVGDIFYTIHPIPHTKFNYAYCPRVNPKSVDVSNLKKSLKENRCIGLTFDVPNVLKGSQEERDAIEIFSKHCKRSGRSEFAKANVLLDLKRTERELFESMSKKHKYNTRYALKNGVSVQMAETKEDFEIFFDLYKKTAERQRFFIRPKRYYELIWEKLHSRGMCQILTAYYESKPLVSWMVFVYDNVLYYPYGGSSEEHRNVFAGNALGWEVIRFGLNSGCEVFDMWGAAEDPEDPSDEYYGFTNFKLKFGGAHVKYMDSYDLVINKPAYFLFNRLNNIRWKLLRLGLIK